MLFRRTKPATWLPSVVVLAAFSLGGPTAAQEGFPLDGTWRAEDDGFQAVVIMKWTGERIDGQIDPGPDSVPFDNATLDPSTWSVHIEADGPNGGKIVIDGTLQEIGSYHRYIDAVWRQAGRERAVRITRE
jgi:hypothetical protein